MGVNSDGKNIMFLLFGTMFLLLSTFFVSASSVTINSPADNSAVNGTAYGDSGAINLSINVSEDHAITGATNLTLDLGGTNLTYDDRNFSEGTTVVDNLTIDTSGKADGGYTFTVTLWNTSAQTFDLGGRIGGDSAPVTNDNNAPVVSAALPYSVKRQGSISIDFSTTDVTSTTYSTAVKDPSGTTVTTKTGSSIVVSGDELASQGTYTLTTTATDSPGYSSSTDFTFDVQSSGSNQNIQITKGVQAVQQQVSGQDQSGLLFFGVGFLVLLVILLVASGVMSKKK